MWSETASSVQCEGAIEVQRIMTQTPEFTSGAGKWVNGDCPNLPVGSQVKIQAGPHVSFQVSDRILGTFKLSPIIGFQNPGGFDARRHALANQWHAKASVIQGTVLNGSSYRVSLRSRVDQWPNPIRGLTKALLFGEKQDLDGHVLEVFETLGLSHMLAISGLHVGLVLGALWLCAGRLGWPRHPRSRSIFRFVLVCTGALVIASWTLWSPSVVRAGSMAALMSLIPIFGIRLTLFQILAVILIGLALLDPLIGLSTGFMMSAGAILLIAQILWASRVGPLTQLLLMQFGFSCVLAVALSWFLGFAYPWLGVIANVIFVPLLPLILSGLAFLLFIDSNWLTELLNASLLFGFDTLQWVLARTNLGVIPSYWVLSLLFIIGGTVLIPKTLPRWSALLCLMCVVNLNEKSSNTLVVHDIGQGSAATLLSNQKRAIFDLAAGQSDRWSRVGQFLPLSRGQDLEAIFVSHGDMDHAGGLSATLQSISIPKVIEGGGSLSGWLSACRSHHRLGDIEIERLWPIGSIEGSENRQSCVYLLSAQNRFVLMMGDADWFAESQVIKELARRDLIGRINTVVVSHHGARDGSNPSFVELVGAEYALISVGRGNRYGHPHHDVTTRWAESGAEVLRTDVDGALRFDFETGRVSRYRETDPSRWISLLASHR